MAVIHTPEVSGTVAVYKGDGSEHFDTIERAVRGWDKLGRPLVFCGDRLHVAENAPFAHYTEFVNLKPSAAPDWDGHLSALMDTLLERLWYRELVHIDFKYVIETAVREGVRDAVKEHLAALDDGKESAS